jgi:hypothetical protein
LENTVKRDFFEAFSDALLAGDSGRLVAEMKVMVSGLEFRDICDAAFE